MSEKVLPASHFVFLDDEDNQTTRYYSEPIDIIRADHIDEIDEAFEMLAEYHRSGCYLAGFASYELGLWLEPKLRPLVKPQQDTPFIHFGVFRNYSDRIPGELLYSSQQQSLSLKPDWSESDYLSRFDRVKRYIKAGDCYQINLTFPMSGEFDGDPIALYANLRHRQNARYGGFVRLSDDTDILSLSPELFFKKTDDHMAMRPMKGTLPRHKDPIIDARLRAEMAQDAKSRAENLMIVDLLRNDLSRLSQVGSVNVPELFSLETYPTLHQMTSRVESVLEPDTSFREIFTSLFPCGSVTGAPKIRAMEIIQELEQNPRGAYCGAMGFVDPVKEGNSRACFNVAIRTLILNNNKARYDVGSAVVLDSDGEAEYAECLLKSDVLKPSKPYLIETFYYDRQAEYHKTDYHNIGEHLGRLAKAVGDDDRMQDVIERLVRFKPSHSPARIRLTVSEERIKIEDTEFKRLQTPLKIAISKYALTPERQDASAKYSARAFYDGERKRIQKLADVDEVIFLSPNENLCEGSFCSLFIQSGEKFITPPLSQGILDGVLRRIMLREPEVIERNFTLDELLAADKIYLGNSLRGLMEAKLISTDLL